MKEQRGKTWMEATALQEGIHHGGRRPGWEGAAVSGPTALERLVHLCARTCSQKHVADEVCQLLHFLLVLDPD
jgi:hypothetical protein